MTPNIHLQDNQTDIDKARAALIRQEETVTSSTSAYTSTHMPEATAQAFREALQLNWDSFNSEGMQILLQNNTDFPRRELLVTSNNEEQAIYNSFQDRWQNEGVAPDWTTTAIRMNAMQPWLDLRARMNLISGQDYIK